MLPAHLSLLQTHLIGRHLTMACLTLLLAGCAGNQIPVITVHENPRSAVFIETVSGKSFQAAHPIKLKEETVADVLRGVHTQPKTDLLLLVGKAMRTTDLSATRTFFEDDIELLTPHLTAALAQAAPNQRIGFRLSYPPPIPTRSKTGELNVETTSGYLFADGLSLHLTLTQYHYMPGKSEAMQKEPRPLPDPDGLRDREVKFIPEAAVRQESSSWFSKSNDRTVMIDYQMLSKLLAMPPEPQRPAATPVGQPVPSAPVAPAPAASDAELRAFREELKAMQKKLDEQNAELERLKKSSPNK